MNKAIPTSFLLLAALFVGTAALLPAVAAFRYPLEIEMREGTMWLYVLATASGVDIYDNSHVAFLQMCFGPFDPMLKYWIHEILPDLQGWQVCRLPALALPVVMIGAPLTFARKISARKFALAGLIGGICYLLMLGNLYGGMMLTARPDATVHLLGALTILFAWQNIMARSPAWSVAAATLAGTFAALAYNTEWRFAPLLLFILLAWWGAVPAARRGPGMAAACAGFVAAFLAIVGLSVHFDLGKYWLHFYGFYISSGRVGARLPLWSLLRSLGGLSLLPLVPAGSIFFLWKLRKKATDPAARSQAQFLLAGFALLLICLSAAYCLNAESGGVYYFDPFFLAVWLLGCQLLGDRLPDTDNERVLIRGLLFCGFVVVIAISGWTIFGRGIVADTIFMTKQRDKAMQITDALRGFSRSYGITSEETYLFKQRYSGERIDQGDTVYTFMVANKFGPEFTATALRYFADLKKNPPLIVVIGFTASPVLNQIVAGDYTCIYCGNRNILENNAGLDVYARNSVQAKARKRIDIPPIP